VVTAEVVPELVPDLVFDAAELDDDAVALPELEDEEVPDVDPAEPVADALELVLVCVAMMVVSARKSTTAPVSTHLRMARTR
jgi:hypothetical protein